MNERIKELIKSCGIIPEDEHYEVAELVIKECISVMEITDITDFRGIELALKIKQHFGVK